MIISFLPCDVCNKLVLVGKLTLQDKKYYCTECFAEKQNQIEEQTKQNDTNKKAVQKSAK